MRNAILPSLLCSFLVLKTAKPVDLAKWNIFQHQHQQQQQLQLQDAQQVPMAKEVEHIPPPETIPVPRRPHYRFDAAENSVGVLMTTHEEDVVHLWIPLGKRVFTRDATILPTKPVTARITTMIHTSPKLAAPEQLDRIQCDVWTYANRTRGRAKGVPEKWKVSFSRKDGLVRFGDESGSWKRWWLGGKEVESYACS